jgi:hypothetical protein
LATPICPKGSERPKLEVADIFRSHGQTYRATHALTPDQARVMRAIETCRTAALGGHVDVCGQCHFERNAYNSCRNRHCPKCQNLAQAGWLKRQMARILPTHYFHVVFTLPGELRALALHNRKRLFDILFEAASHTLLDLGHDEDRLGALLGLTAVLHTWTRDLSFHPHLHCIVTGGGLRLSPQDDARSPTEWVSRHGSRYLFPVKVLRRLFRGKFMDALVMTRENGKLVFGGGSTPLAKDEAWNAFKDKLYRKEWVVYAKRPFGGAEGVYKYLGRYTHRVGISNYRLQAINDTGVRFSTKGGKSATLKHEEFIRRFLLHVLPKGFVKIRHYGLFAPPNLGTKLTLAHQVHDHNIHHPEKTPDTASEQDWRSAVLELTGVDLTVCPQCKTGTMVPHLSERPRPPPSRIVA